MKKILIINKYFYPGYKAGGPIQSLKNMCDALQDDFAISVLTWDRDYMDESSYDGIEVDNWNTMNNYKVFYAKNKLIDKNVIIRAIEDVKPDLIYLNSFFDKISISSIKIVKKYNIPIVLAPRGEFSMGALQIKKVKKKVFLTISKVIGIYKNITYHATNEMEKKDIENIMRKVPIIVSENFVKKPFEGVNTKEYDDELRIVYISRVTPKKNLLFLLDVFSELKISKKIILDIYGPVDDNNYWDKCKESIAKLNDKNIKVNYLGPISPNEFQNIYEKAHFSILPTLGENFGHSIYESLAHSVPVIVSDKTPWRDLESKKAGFDIKLDKKEFQKVFEKLDRMSSKEYADYTKGALSLANEYYSSLYAKSLKDDFIKAMR
jgi:glycosyltransferase involved in cell wall biosynthesis